MSLNPVKAARDALARWVWWEPGYFGLGERLYDQSPDCGRCAYRDRVIARSRDLPWERWRRSLRRWVR